MVLVRPSKKNAAIISPFVKNEEGNRSKFVLVRYISEREDQLAR